MGPPSYMRPVVDRNVVMRRIPVVTNTAHSRSSVFEVVSVSFQVVLVRGPKTGTQFSF